MRSISSPLVAGLLLAASASPATAAFFFSDVRAAVSGSSTLQRVTFYARTDGQGTSLGATRLQALELNVSSAVPMTFAYDDITGDGLDDVNLTAASSTLPGASIRTTRVSSEIFAPLFDFPDFPGGDPNPENVSTPTYDAVAAYTNRSSFYALGAALGATAGVPAVAGRGAAFMTVVVPTGTTVSIVGQVAGDMGTAEPTAVPAGLDGAPLPGLPFVSFSYVSVVPEPTVLAATAAAGVLVGRRRRRAAR